MTDTVPVVPVVPIVPVTVPEVPKEPGMYVNGVPVNFKD